MRFWDASSIIPLCLKEKSSKAVKSLMKTDDDIVVWWMTHIEYLSALSRRQRERALPSSDAGKARALLSALAAAWSEVQSTEMVRGRAERLLSIHPLRAADAMQFAAALVWAQETPSGFDFVCLDQNPREAALKEGFSIRP